MGCSTWLQERLDKEASTDQSVQQLQADLENLQVSITGNAVSLTVDLVRLNEDRTNRRDPPATVSSEGTRITPGGCVRALWSG